MEASVTTTVRLTLRELAVKIAAELGIEGDFDGADMQGDVLVMSFSRDPVEQSGSKVAPAAVRSKAEAEPGALRRSRTKRKGWEVVARITNSKGQIVAIYRPFVEALQAPGTPEELRERVQSILKSNGNAPTEATIRYYLSNTLQYLEQEGAVTP